MTNDLGERRDLAEERDSEEYQEMVRAVWIEWSEELASLPFSPDSLSVHLEAIRRLKEKYAQE